MTDDYKKENRVYKTKLAKYKMAKAVTSVKGQLTLAAATFAILTPISFNMAIPDNDTEGTENRTEVLAKLNTEKQTLMQSVNSFEQQRTTLNNTTTTNEQYENAKEQLKAQQNQLTQQTKTFFTDLITSGSMKDGLAISEQDAEDLIQDLQRNVGDFDWSKHTDENISTIINMVTENANMLDEVRADHRYDKSATLSDRFDTAVSIATTKTGREFLFTISLLGILLISMVPALIAESLEKNIKRMEKPRPPTKPASH